LNIDRGFTAKPHQTGDDDSSPAFIKYSKFQTNSTDPKFITEHKNPTDEAFLEEEKEIKLLKQKIFFLKKIKSEGNASRFWSGTV
jgi:hypothetical protein